MSMTRQDWEDEEARARMYKQTERSLTAQEVGGTFVCPLCGFDLTANYAFIPVDAVYRIEADEEGRAVLYYKHMDFEGGEPAFLFCDEHGKVALPDDVEEIYQ